MERRNSQRANAGQSVQRAIANDWGKYAAAIRQWEQLTGTTAPPPTDNDGRLNPDLPEWMMGYPQGWTASISRAQRLKAVGNAVQPQTAHLAVLELTA